MSGNLKAIERKPDQDIIGVLERALEKARRGDLLDVIVVASSNDGDGLGHYWSTAFDDRWRLLAALEYAKSGVLKT